MDANLSDTLTMVAAGLLLAGLTGVPIWQIALGWASRTWPTVEGEIFASQVRKFRDPETNFPGAWAQIGYRYTANDRVYTGSRVCFGYGLHRNPGVAEETASRYSVGTKVTVHYQPGKPEVATLETRAVWIMYMFALIGLLLGCVCKLKQERDSG